MKMKARKIILAMLIAVVLLIVTACGDGKPDPSDVSSVCQCPNGTEHENLPCCEGIDCGCIKIPKSIAWNGIPVYLDGGTYADWTAIKVHLDFNWDFYTDKQKENISSFLTRINIRSSGVVTRNKKILNITFTGELPPYYDGTTYHNIDLAMAINSALYDIQRAYDIWNQMLISDYPNTTNMETQWIIIKGWLNIWYESKDPSKQEIFNTRIEQIIIRGGEIGGDYPDKDQRPILWIGEYTDQLVLTTFLDKIVTYNDTWNGIPMYDDTNINYWYNSVKTLLDTYWGTLNDSQKAKFSNKVKMICAGYNMYSYDGIMLTIGFYTYSSDGEQKLISDEEFKLKVDSILSL